MLRDLLRDSLRDLVCDLPRDLLRDLLQDSLQDLIQDPPRELFDDFSPRRLFMVLNGFRINFHLVIMETSKRRRRYAIRDAVYVCICIHVLSERDQSATLCLGQPGNSWLKKDQTVFVLAFYITAANL